MSVITRFAPSPTGFLHIGGARTALFNYLYTKNKGGKFLLRIEDTDKKRSTQAAIDAIKNGLNWLGIKHDDEIVLQSQREARHKEVAYELLKKGAAYKCFCTTEELDELRKKAESEGKNFKYPKIWRDTPEDKHPDKSFAIRIKAPLEGDISINDLVQGEVKYPANDLDDMVLLRADGTPTYMLAVVVDDHDMNITHIIRGDDHLTNAFRQILIYKAMNWKIPELAHIPLIHGADGAKLSKRHGALGVEEYRDMGYLPEAICNYIMGLGWHWGDEETLSMSEAAKRFDIARVGKSPSRFDFAKLNHINGLYLRQKSVEENYQLAKPFLEKKWGDKLTPEIEEKIKKLLPEILQRTQNLVEITNNPTTSAIFARIEPIEPKAQTALAQGKEHTLSLIPILEETSDWSEENIKKTLDDYGTSKNIKAGQYLPALRAAVYGSMETASLMKFISVMEKDEILKRLKSI